MSREVRRVPLDFRHPIVHNPHWAFQASTSHGRTKSPSRLHGPTEMFQPLHGESVGTAQAIWDVERERWQAGEHEHLTWLLKYYSADGWTDHKGILNKPKPYEVRDESGEVVVRAFFPETAADLLAVYPYEDYARDRPTTETHMPDFDVPTDELGWCLYESVSEGTPTTPVFATAEELIDWLCEKGQDYDQVPMRRESAEIIVGRGYTVGSLVTSGGKVYRSDEDADLIEREVKA